MVKENESLLGDNYENMKPKSGFSKKAKVLVMLIPVAAAIYALFGKSTTQLDEETQELFALGKHIEMRANEHLEFVNFINAQVKELGDETLMIETDDIVVDSIRSMWGQVNYDDSEELMEEAEKVVKESTYLPGEEAGLKDAAEGMAVLVEQFRSSITDMTGSKEIAALTERIEKDFEFINKMTTKDYRTIITQVYKSSASLQRNVIDINGIAFALKRGSSTVIRIVVKGGMFAGAKEARYFAVGIRVLAGMFDRFPNKVASIKKDIGLNSDALEGASGEIKAIMEQVKQFVAGLGSSYASYALEQRAIAYGICSGATVLTGGVAAGPCFATAAGILETKLAKMRETGRRTKTKALMILKSFDELKTKCAGAAKEAMKWYALTEQYDTEVNTAKDVFMSVVKDMFDANKFDFDTAWDMKDLLAETLTELVKASDVLLVQCKTKMAEMRGPST